MNGSRAERLAQELRRPGPEPGGRRFVAEELIRLATLAASGHNTQPWRFCIESGAIRILPDFNRATPIVDPHDAHLYCSLGCAAENLVHAAAAQGFHADVGFDSSDTSLRVSLERDAGLGAGHLYRALLTRQCSRVPYAGGSLPTAVLDRLQRAGSGEGIATLVYAGHLAREALIGFIEAGNRSQLGDPKFRGELLAWMRPNAGVEHQHRDGLSARVLGKPALPLWLARHIVPRLLNPDRQTARDACSIRSAAAIAIVMAGGEGPRCWVEAGRAIQRLLLEAEFHDVRAAFLNQPIEAADVYPTFRDWLGDVRYPMVMIRLGRGPRSPYSLRRPVRDVIET